MSGTPGTVSFSSSCDSAFVQSAGCSDATNALELLDERRIVIKPVDEVMDRAFVLLRRRQSSR